MPATLWAPSAIARVRPVQRLGDHSYSLYLWHWPLFMFVPHATGMPSPPWLMVLLVACSLVLAAASKRWIEDPVRFGLRGATMRPRPLPESGSP